VAAPESEALPEALPESGPESKDANPT